MTGILKEKSDTKRIAITDANGKRHYLRFGSVDMKTEETLKENVKKLVIAKKWNTPIDADAARWVATLPDDIHAKLAEKGIIAKRRKVGTLGELFPAFIKCRAATVSEQTIEVWGAVRGKFISFLWKG